MNKQLPFLLGLFSVLFCFANLNAQTCTGNLVTNPGFEICGGGTNSCLNDWSVTGSVGIVTDARSGSYAARSSGQAGSLSQIKPCTVGQTFSAVVWGKGTNNSTGYAPIVFLRFLQSNYAPIGDFTTAPIESKKQILTNQYTEHYVVATAPANAAYVHLLVMNEAGASFTVDDMHLCLGTGAGSNLPELFPLGYAVTENAQNPNGSTKISSGFLLQNSGGGTITNDFTIVWRISTDETPSANDYILHVQNFTNDLPPNQPIGIQQLAGNVPVGTPNLPPGTYKLIVCLDDGNTVVEGSEVNNCLSGVVTIYGNSTACSMTASVASTQCLDNGTPSNPNDDRYKVFLNVSGTNTGIGWNATTSGASNNYSYGNNIELVGQFAISFGPWTLSLYDANSPTNPCFTTVSITPPAACSNGPGTGQIDLSLALQQLTATPTQWNNYSVKATISNAGPQAATGVKVKFAKPTGVVYVGGNEFTASQGSFNPNGDQVWTVGSIPANGSATLTVNYFLLNATAPVAYAQVTAANETDSDSQPNNGTPPTPVQDDEATTSSGGGPTPQPDFVINPNSFSFVELSTIPTIPPQRVYGFGLVVQNIGASIAAGGSPLMATFYLSTDGTLSADDYLLGTHELAGSGPAYGQQATIQSVPTGIPGGAYNLIVKLDPGNLFAESNENNNVAVYGQQVVLPNLTSTQQPDLTISDLQIQNTSIAAGSSLSYTYDFSNIGTGAFSGTYSFKSYISTDNTLSANDIEELVGVDGASNPGFFQNNKPGGSLIPPGLAAGNYFLIIKVDADNAVTESNESNNTVSMPFSVITVGGGDACEKSLVAGGLICAEKTAAGNYRLAVSPQSGTIYKRYEFTSGGNLVSNLPDAPLPTTLKIENGKVVERAGGTGLLLQEILIPASLMAQYNPKVVCRQTGTSNFFMGGSNTGPESVFLKLDANLNVLASLQVPGSVAQAIAPTSWGGAVIAAGYPTSLPSSGSNGFLYTISASAALLHSHQVAFFVTSVLPLPCGTDAFRFMGTFSGGGGGSGVDFDIESDYSFTQQAAQQLRRRSTGYSFNSPLPLVFETTHQFNNPDGTRWQIIRRKQAADPQYNVVGIDSAWYEKRSATDQLLLHQGLNKSVMSQYINAIAEIETGKLAFFGTKNGQAWHYYPFCGGTTPPSGCAAITITPGPSKITIAGFSAPHVLIKVFRPNWTVAYECLDGQCATPTVVTGLGAGTHHVQVKLINNSWQEICFLQQSIGVTNLFAPEDDRLRLAFNKFYPNPAAYLTTMELYSPVEQAATLDFYDRTGRLVHTLEVQLEQGQNLIEQLVFDWKSGTYNVVARGEKTGLPAYGRFLKVWEE